ncbi:hypothetical protein RRG08_007240 [Elysia crispata]|uniref:Uncharacterized protein n=1 Tax=Elysia crispata TaxID=231223 RepID=A0AAE0ZTY5_9GAST|nr:hypothetical protein RRG08_007240 [Elysia crispata]
MSQTDLKAICVLATLFVIVSITSSNPVSKDKDQQQLNGLTTEQDWKSPLAITIRPTHKTATTLSSLEREIIAFMNDFEDENKQTSESSYILTTVKTPKTTPEGEDALVDEVIEFMKTAEEEDMTSLKPQDNLWQDVTRENLELNSLAITTSHKDISSHSTPQPAAMKDFSTTRTGQNSAETSSKYSTTSYEPVEKNDTSEVVKMESMQETIIDTKIILIIGAIAAGLLVVLMVVVLFAIFCCPKSSKNKGMYLNSDFNRWDPQLLRPSQKSVDTFIFGTPIPSISEMIKAQECSQNST